MDSKSWQTPVEDSEMHSYTDQNAGDNVSVSVLQALILTPLPSIQP